MKLHLSLLKNFIDLQSRSDTEIRQLLDDLGLEVKNIDTTKGDTVFTIETLANRGDHLYALGVARELSSRILTPIKHPSLSELTDRKPNLLIKNITPKSLRYCVLELSLPSEITISPEIRAVVGEAKDKRPAIVDILNYVQHEIGQPMHAFDKDKIDGELAVDTTTEEIEVEGLDFKKYKVPAGSIIMKDRSKILAVGGIIGCSNSMCTVETKRVLIESATFEPVQIRKTAKAMGVSTEASYFFERGGDVDLPVTALKRIVHILAASQAKGDAAQVIGFFEADHQPTEKRKIIVSIKRLRAEMNIAKLPEGEVISRLRNLGYQITYAEGLKTFECTVPSWRLWDIINENDIVEDFVRAHSLSSVKLQLPDLDSDIPEQNPYEDFRDLTDSFLINNGYNEIITKAFYSNEDLTFLESLLPEVRAETVSLKNSIESGYAHLKVTNVLHLTTLLSEQLRRGATTYRIFDYTKFFGKDQTFGNLYQHEYDVLCMMQHGRLSEGEWRKPESLEDRFFAFKGDILSVIEINGFQATVRISKHPLLHSGMQAEVLVGRDIVATFGVIHPIALEYKALKGDPLYAEFYLEKLFKDKKEKVFSLPNDLPTIKRDVTISIDKKDMAGKLIEKVKKLNIEDLIDIYIVDDFPTDLDRKLSLRFTFQNLERTLLSGEVDELMAKISTHL